MNNIVDGFLTPVAENTMTKIPCYLRTLRREWGMTQNELAGLMLRGGRVRVSSVERAKISPNAAEILAYSLLFGFPPAEIFPAFYESVEEALIERAYALDELLQNDHSKRAERKRQLLYEALARATGHTPNPLIV